MEVKAKLSNLRIAPRKVRLVADLIRQKRAKEALTILNFTVKKASHPLQKLLNSALANAKNNFQLNPDNLYISKITIDEGPKYKRWMPRARGSAYEIQKKTSHITLILDEIKVGARKKKIGKTAKETGKTKEIKETMAAKEERRGWKELAKREMPKPKEVKGIRRFFQRKAV
jgi:large subunit ribosomal protein L22